MPSRKKPLVTRAEEAAEHAPSPGQTQPIAHDAMLAELEPFLPGMLRTLGLAGQTTGEGKDEKPGDVKAAGLGIEVFLKLTQGRSSDRGRRALELIRKIREGQREGNAAD